MQERMLEVKSSAGKEMQVIKGRARLVPAPPKVSPGSPGLSWLIKADTCSAPAEGKARNGKFASSDSLRNSTEQC